MKLFKKLLPIATVLSTAAVVTPLAVSCKEKINYKTVDGLKVTEEEMEDWESSAITAPTDQDQIFTDYVDNGNTPILHDFKYYLFMAAQMYDSAEILKGGFANVKFEKIESKWYLSFNFTAHIYTNNSDDFWDVVLTSSATKWPYMAEEIAALGGYKGFAPSFTKASVLDKSKLAVSEKIKVYDKKDDGSKGKQISSSSKVISGTGATAKELETQISNMKYGAMVTTWISYWIKDIQLP